MNKEETNINQSKRIVPRGGCAPPHPPANSRVKKRFGKTKPRVLSADRPRTTQMTQVFCVEEWSSWHAVLQTRDFVPFARQSRRTLTNCCKNNKQPTRKKKKKNVERKINQEQHKRLRVLCGSGAHDMRFFKHDHLHDIQRDRVSCFEQQPTSKLCKGGTSGCKQSS